MSRTVPVHPFRFAALLAFSVVFWSAIVFCTENPFGSRGLRFGYSATLLSEVSRADAEAALALWTRELARVAGYTVPTKLTVYEDLPTFVTAIQKGEIDFIALSSLDYMKIRGQVPMEHALFGERHGKSGDEQILLVRKDGGIRKTEQLQGKRLTYLHGGSGEIAALWLDVLLARQGLPPGARFLSATREGKNAMQVILPVFFRQADACVVGRTAFETAVELNPQLGVELLALESSPSLPVAVTCFRTSLTRRQKEEFLRMSFEMVNSPAGKQILTLFRVDNITRSTDNVMDALNDLLREADRRKVAYGRYAR